MALDYPPQLKAVKMSVVVQPAELAKKLMDIREQLALEWREDLKNIEVRATRQCNKQRSRVKTRTHAFDWGHFLKR